MLHILFNIFKIDIKLICISTWINLNHTHNEVTQ